MILSIILQLIIIIMYIIYLNYFYEISLWHIVFMFFLLLHVGASIYSEVSKLETYQTVSVGVLKQTGNKYPSQQQLSTGHIHYTRQKLHRLHTLHITSRRRRPNLIKIVSIVCAKFVQFHSSYKKCRNAHLHLLVIY